MELTNASRKQCHYLNVLHVSDTSSCVPYRFLSWTPEPRIHDSLPASVRCTPSKAIQMCRVASDGLSPHCSRFPSLFSSLEISRYLRSVPDLRTLAKARNSKMAAYKSIRLRGRSSSFANLPFLLSAAIFTTTRPILQTWRQRRRWPPKRDRTASR
jgi:hypothetical protein